MKTDDLNKVLASLDDQNSADTDELHIGGATPDSDIETLHVYPMGDGLYITSTPLKEDETEQIVETTAAALPGSRFPLFAKVIYVLFVVSLLVAVGNLFSLAFLQSVTVTIVASVKPITATHTLQVVTGIPTSESQVQARQLTPITLSQTTTVAATGTAHQEPTYAIGYLTFYNGQFTQVHIPAGTQLTASDGTALVTNQTVIIPAVDASATPPAIGQATVAAHALYMGSAGNISAFSINGPCCTTSVLVKNTQAFTGGQDARTFTIVRQSDITNAATTLKQSLSQSMQGAVNAQVQKGEALLPVSCSPTVSSDKQPGDEATSIHVSASETCNGQVYNKAHLLQTLQHQFITTVAQQLGKGFSLIDRVRVSLSTSYTSQGMFLAVTCLGVWGYVPNGQQQEEIKQQLAGKTQDQAAHTLTTLSGIQSFTINTHERKLPNDPNRIQLVFLYVPVTA